MRRSCFHDDIAATPTVPEPSELGRPGGWRRGVLARIFAVGVSPVGGESWFHGVSRWRRGVLGRHRRDLRDGV